MTELLTSTQAARRLRVSDTTVRRMARDGVFAQHQEGNWLLLDPAEVDAVAAEEAKWVSEREAANIAGCSPGSINRAGQEGKILRRDRRPRLSRASVEEYAAKRAKEQPEPARVVNGTSPSSEDTVWVSWAEASALTSIPVPTLDWWSRPEQGRIRRRPRHGNRATLDRESVLAFAENYAIELAAKERRRIEKPKRSKSRKATTPDHGWLTVLEAAERFGVSAATVRSRIESGTLEGVRREGGRFGYLWVREEASST